MTMDPSSLVLTGARFFKPSHRTRPEQIVGYAIFLLVSFAFALLNGRWIHFSLQGEWYRSLAQAPWAFASWPYGLPWIVYHFVFPLAMWILWRRFSLRLLKVELSVFLAQFFLQTGWILSFFFFQETLLGLTILLLLWCNTLLSALLFWKKERISGQLLLFPLLWIFYVLGLNMVICIFNP